jgi:hypothetical protein
MVLANRSPSPAPPDTAIVDNSTVVLDDTGGQPQSAPRFVCPKLEAADTTANAAVAASFVSVCVVFIFCFFVFDPLLLMDGTNVNKQRVLNGNLKSWFNEIDVNL